MALASDQNNKCVVVRSEESTLARVIAIAHGAGVHDIELAYESASGGGEVR